MSRSLEDLLNDSPDLNYFYDDCAHHPATPDSVLSYFNISPSATHDLFTERFPFSPAWISPGSYISPVIRSSSFGTPEKYHPRILTKPKNQTFLERLLASAPSPGSTHSSPERPLAQVCHNSTQTPASNSADIFALSPLTPLTPTTNTHVDLRIPTKRRLALQDQVSPTPLPRAKRLRYSYPNLPPPSPSASVSTSPPPTLPIFTNRTFSTAEHLDISPLFPLFYRRFPTSPFFQPPSAEYTFNLSAIHLTLSNSIIIRSPCTLFNVQHPGGTYNPPRSAFDLYTPRFVKGKGADKVGLCPICVEDPQRGGEGKKVWLAMKFSAFKCYHMQYAHGISASTGRPFSPPTAFRHTTRTKPGKLEKPAIQEGKCHKCGKWVAVEGIKDIQNKVKEIFWWKHAAVCHHSSTLDDEADVYEKDWVYERLLIL